MNFFKKYGFKRAIEMEWEEKKEAMNSIQYRKWLKSEEGLRMFCELMKYDVKRCGEQLRMLNIIQGNPEVKHIAECVTCGFIPVDEPIEHKLDSCPYCQHIYDLNESYRQQIKIH